MAICAPFVNNLLWTLTALIYLDFGVASKAVGLCVCVSVILLI